MLLYALARQQPLRRGNQQVALAAMLQFLALNGQDMDSDPPGPAAAMVTQLAAGALDVKDVADWLAPRLQPSGRAATQVKEAPMRGRPALPLAERIKRATTRTRPKDMFMRFTGRARQVVVLAQEEARMLNHNYIGTEHILLGLIREGDGVGAKALESLGISLDAVRQQIEEIIGRGQHTPSGHIPFTPRAKKVLELSLRESVQLGHDYIGTEHILLGLIREGDGVAAQVLVKLGADRNRVRQQVIQLISTWQEQPGEAMKVRPREAADQPAALAFLARHNSARVARLGELLEPLDHPALLAEADGEMLGMLTYVPDPGWEQCEVLTLHVTGQWHGVGTALIQAVEQLTAGHGCARLWLITTNDNVDALRFYQRRGFQLAAVHRHAVDDSRSRLKPEIPVAGAYGIPIRDEIELEKRPRTPAPASGESPELAEGE